MLCGDMRNDDDLAALAAAVQSGGPNGRGVYAVTLAPSLPPWGFVFEGTRMAVGASAYEGCRGFLESEGVDPDARERSWVERN